MLPPKGTLGDINILRDDYRVAIEDQRDQIAFLGTSWEATLQYIHPCSTRGSDGKLYDSLQSSLNQDPTTTSSSYWKLHGITPTDTSYYDTIAQLRLSGTSPTKEYATVLGYYTPGDGGGGPLRVWKTGGAYVDNGGSVITPGGVPGTAAWAWDKPIFVDDRFFGSKADGTTYDTEAIQTTWDYCSSNKIKCVHSSGARRISGSVLTSENLTVEWSPGAVFLPDVHSVSGAIVTNVRADVSDPAIIQDNVTLINPQIDGINLPNTDDDNAIGFARGMAGLKIVGGTIKNFPMFNAVGGLGGKGINLERGVTDALIDGTTVENCFIAYFSQGTDGTFPSGASETAQRHKFSNITSKNCGAAFAAFGVDSDESPDGDPSAMFIDVDGLLFYNCGHAPGRTVTGDQQKSGAIVIGEGQNASIKNVKGWNDPAIYPPAYPTDPNDVYFGLSGPIGAVIWGWGRNIYVENIEYNGACDTLVQINRARALGDDAGPTGKLSNVFNFNCRSIKHIGAADYVISYDPTSLRPNAGDLTGEIVAYADTLNSGISAPEGSVYTGYYLDVFSPTLTEIKGAVSNVQPLMNTFSDAIGKKNLIGSSTYATEVKGTRFYTQEITLADDTATSINVPTDAGVLSISSDTSLLRVLVSFRANVVGAQIANMGNAVANFAVTTGPLTGTDGSDGNYTVSSHTDGKLYFENRRGGTVTIVIMFIG